MRNLLNKGLFLWSRFARMRYEAGWFRCISVSHGAHFSKKLHYFREIAIVTGKPQLIECKLKGCSSSNNNLLELQDVLQHLSSVNQHLNFRLACWLISIHQNHPTFHHVNSPYKDACSGGRKSAIWIPNTLHKVKGQLNILILLSWHGRFYIYTFNAYITSCFCIYNYNTVSGEASLVTGHATVFNVCIAGLLVYPGHFLTI
jgi:hypothetical protein